MWAVLAVMTGVFMGGLTSLTPESSAAHKTGKGLGFLLIVYGLLMLLGSLTGGSNPLKPLATVNFGGGAAVVEDIDALAANNIELFDLLQVGCGVNQ